MNWQARANSISLGMLFFATQDAILAAAPATSLQLAGGNLTDSWPLPLPCLQAQAIC